LVVEVEVLIYGEEVQVVMVVGLQFLDIAFRVVVEELEEVVPE
jgi:hypothetical protein